MENTRQRQRLGANNNIKIALHVAFMRKPWKNAVCYNAFGAHGVHSVGIESAHLIVLAHSAPQIFFAFFVEIVPCARNFLHSSQHPPTPQSNKNHVSESE